MKECVLGARIQEVAFEILYVDLACFSSNSLHAHSNFFGSAKSLYFAGYFIGCPLIGDYIIGQKWAYFVQS